jgi:hypothetical protein
LQSKVNADVFLIGLVEDFGEVRVGADTYPSISFSARLVNARTAEIIWAATISKTGADNVKIFDIGRVSSLGKLSKQAVEAMAKSMAVSRGAIVASLKASPGSPAALQAGLPAHGDGSEKPPVLALVDPATARAAAQTGKSSDETATYGEAELTALLKDIAGVKPGPVTHKKHFHDVVETRYPLGADGAFAEVKLTDYRKVSVSQSFLKHNQPSGTALTFESFPAVEGVSAFDYYNLDAAVGRFGLSIRGPKGRKDDITALAKGIVGFLK